MRHRARRLCALILTLAAGALTLSSLAVVRQPEPLVDPPGIVNDISRLNPVRVAEVLTPTTTQEIVQAVSNHPGPISIGGARHSMGGQIAAEGSLHIDMRRLNRILEFDARARTIRVQAGTRWRQIQEHVDPSGLAVANMQSYASFTVGGSLSVNAHGRYVGAGPLISSVRSLEIVLADGSRIEASPSRNTDVFYGAIGGYGGLGVITEVTLGLADNVRVERRQRTVRIDALPDYVVRDVLSGPTGAVQRGPVSGRLRHRARGVLRAHGASGHIAVPPRSRDPQLSAGAVAVLGHGRLAARQGLSPLRRRSDRLSGRAGELAQPRSQLRHRASGARIAHAHDVPAPGVLRARAAHVGIRPTPA